MSEKSDAAWHGSTPPDLSRSQAVQKWADEAMFEAEPLGYDVNKEGPKVHLLSMSHDPLGQIAAMAMMYEGKVARSLSDITDEQRVHYFNEVKKTHLKAPFESVQFHFMLDGVTRSFTHQAVRQRTAVFAQESLRFAVKDGIDEEVALPPSIIGAKDDDPRVVLWRSAINKVDDTYHALVEAGMPAEDARGLLPHNITTRMNYVTNLRNLQDHAGMRLCTQAQFEWRTVWVRIVEVIRNYDPRKANAERLFGESTVHWTPDMLPDRWQFEMLADLFRPVCYLTGKCEFKADFDRKCKIRNRVDANHEIGRESAEWNEEYDEVDAKIDPLVGVGPHSVIRMPEEEGHRPVFIGAIHPAEWLTDPSAAR